MKRSSRGLGVCGQVETAAWETAGRLAAIAIVAAFTEEDSVLKETAAMSQRVN